MHISVTVPYDEARQRRVLKFLLRSQMKPVRISGAVLAGLGAVLVVLSPTSFMPYAALAIGLLFLVAVEPLALRLTMSGLPAALKLETAYTLDDEWVTAITTLIETRVRWDVVDRVVETPDGWYFAIGRYQALLIAKELLSEEQRAEFAAFVSGMTPTKR